MSWNTLSLKVLATCEIWDGSSEGTADMDGTEDGALDMLGVELGVVEGESLGSMDKEGITDGAPLNEGVIEGAPLYEDKEMNDWHVKQVQVQKQIIHDIIITWAIGGQKVQLMVQQKWRVCLKAVGLASGRYWDLQMEKRC